MNFGYREVCLDHDTGPRHPESADRLRAIRRTLADRHGVEYVAASDADRSLLESVHDSEYLDEIREFCRDGGGSWDADTVAVEDTWRAAVAAAGLAEWVATAAYDGASGRATPFSIGRPPGHHAMSDDARGFCFLNNTVIGAQAALDAGADRVANVDWDVHHGDGIQELCYQRSDIFNVSIHEDGLYPGTGEIEETGVGDAQGTTCNVPFPPGTDDADYLAVVDEVIGPSIEAFDPDLLLVSAGFDAHQHDPISRMRVSTEGYGCLARTLADLAASCDAGIGFLLEGGYGLDTLSQCVATVHEVFDGYEPERPDDDVSEGAREVIDALLDQGFGST